MKLKKNEFEGDNWLEKELERESKVSAWDFDEGKKLRMEHEEDCDVRELADEHHRQHVRMNDFNKNRSSKTTAASISWFIMDVVLLFVLIFFHAFAFPDRFNYLSVVLLFLGINPGIFIWLFLLHRFPSEAYSKLLFFMSLLLELYWFITNLTGIKLF